MMERRRAISVPFPFTKDNRMDSPLRVAKTCLSPERGKLEKRVPWTAFSDCRRSLENLPPKNGSTTYDRSRAVTVNLEIMRRVPLLVLTDVLKTKLGRDYMERIKRAPSCSRRRSSSGSGRSGTQSRRASAQVDLRSSTGNTDTTTKNDRNRRCKSETFQRRSRTSSTPTKTPTTAVKRKRVRPGREQNTDEKEEANEKDSSEESLVSKNIQEDEDFSEVVDCELSLSCEPAEDSKDCRGFDESRIKNKWSESAKDANHNLGPEVSQQKQKRKNSGSHCNGSISPKRQRESVLRLSGEDRLDASVSLEQSEENLESLDPCIVQFTVGGDDHTEVSLSLINAPSEADDVDGRSKLGSQSSKETPSEHSDPIVLSSDEEETRSSSQVVKLGESVIRGVAPRRPKQKQVSETHSKKVVAVEKVPRLAAHRRLTDADGSVIQVPFYHLYCGGSRGRANGFLLIKNQEIFIPLKDKSGHQRVLIRLSGAALRKYSVWEQSQLETERLYFKDETEPDPVDVLLLFLSENAAATVQRDLCRLQGKENGALNTGEASPFILMTLKEPLQGVKGALLRSYLDIECLGNVAHKHVNPGVDKRNGFEDSCSPNLSLDESLELIKRTGRDSHLLSILGIQSDDSSQASPQDSSQPEEDRSLSVKVQLLDEPREHWHGEPQKEPEKAETQEASVPGPTSEVAAETSFKTSEDQIEAEPQSTEKQKEEPAPVYTLAHRRVKNTYCVSLCKRDPHWVKYKHKGLPRRLIQFPPPPLKGGITVTLEDLQCLDNGQFLNDVIIDFYLKYLLQKASAAVAERCHIFSSFFYKQLTRRNNASEGSNSEACQRQRRHQRVKTWTRHVDIFNKDFLFVPVNQEAHWYLVVICFPGLEEPRADGSKGQQCSSETAEQEQEQEETQGCTDVTDPAQSPPAPTNSDTGDTQSGTEDSTKDSIPGPVSCTESTCHRTSVCKRPCILIMDSLKLSLHERVFKLLRDYLQSEWEVRRGSQREFGSDQMKSSHCRVPLQDNSSDCGLYLLQYVECFLKDPVAHFELPLNLEQWFSRQQVRRKREEIRELILYLYRHQNLENRHVDTLLN